MSCRQMPLHTVRYLPVLCLVALVATNVYLYRLPGRHRYRLVPTPLPAEASNASAAPPAEVSNASTAPPVVASNASAAPNHSTADRACAQGYAAVTDAEGLLRRNAGLTRRQKPRRIAYLTMYDCEERMLELHLREMASVDLFLVGESKYSNANTLRGQCFPHSNPVVSAHKNLTYIYNTEHVKRFTYWEAEVRNRDQLGEHLCSSPEAAQFQDDDLVMISDMDEILSAVFVDLLAHYDGWGEGLSVSLRWSYYGFQWVNPNLFKVNLAVTWRRFREHSCKANAIRFNLMETRKHRVVEGVVGWHCSWCFPTDHFQHKLRHSAHVELATERNMDLGYLTSMREQGLWFATGEPNGCLGTQEELPWS